LPLPLLLPLPFFLSVILSTVEGLEGDLLLALALSSSSLEPVRSWLSITPYPATTYSHNPQKQTKTSVSSPRSP
jgi:hypothetical protein